MVDDKKRSDWELESSFDLASTLEDMINDKPFKEASDESGESVTAGARVPSWLHRRVVKLRELAASPYEVNSDVYRDAIYNGLHVLHMRYGLTAAWGIERQMAAVVDEATAGKRIRDQVDDLISGLEELRASGDEEMTIQRLTEYVLAANELSDVWYRERIFRFLKSSRAIRDIADECKPAITRLIFGRGKKATEQRPE